MVKKKKKKVYPWSVYSVQLSQHIPFPAIHSSLLEYTKKNKAWPRCAVALSTNTSGLYQPHAEMCFSWAFFLAFHNHRASCVHDEQYSHGCKNK